MRYRLAPAAPELWQGERIRVIRGLW